MLETLDALAAGSAREIPQPAHGITYAEKIAKAEARIEWNDAAAAIWRKVRAFNPWPVAATALAGVQLRIWEAELVPRDSVSARAAAAPRPPIPGSVLHASDSGIDVACGEGALRILRLQLAGRRPLTAAQFIQSSRLTGARFQSP